MKKVCLVLAVVMMGFASLVSAQKPFTGTIKFHTHIEGTDDPNILSQGESDYSTTLFGNYTKTIISPQEGFGIITIKNGDAKSITMIIDIAGMGKYYIESNPEKIQEKQKNLDYKYDKTGEKKTIAGYECEKVVVTVTDKETDESESAVIYVSTAINSGADINFQDFPKLNGYPMRIEQKEDVDGTEITMVIEAVEVLPSKKIKIVDFMLPSDAQDLKSNPQLMKMFGMGGDDEEEE